MRNLYVNIKQDSTSDREKVFVFVEDIDGVTRISGIRCTRLGDLHSGETGRFLIEEGNVRIFAIPENQGANYDYTPLRLPVGDDDISLLGEFKMAEDGTKAFTLSFDKNPPARKEAAKKAEEPKKSQADKKAENPKGAVAPPKKENDKAPDAKQKKAKPVTIILVVIAAILIGSLLGYTITTAIISATKAQPKDFTAGSFNITLTGNFTQEYSAGYTTSFVSKDVAVFVLEEKYDSDEALSTFSVEDYLKAMITLNSFKNMAICTDVDIYFFEYSSVSSSNGKEYIHYVYAYKTDTSFWTVQFVVNESKTSKYLDKISNWARSVNFT